MRAPAEAGPFTNVSGDLTVTTFVDKDIEPGATYFYRVLAFAGTTNSPESNAASVTLAPAPPSDVLAVGVTGAVTVTWTNSPFASGVRISRGSQTGGPYTQVGGDIATPAVSFGDTSVTAGQTYFYVLTSFSDGGESAQSSEVSAASH
jgi:fibronectin type 3 domain-containing protein